IMAVRADKFLVFMRGGEGTAVDAAALETRTRRLREKIVEALPAQLPAGAEVPAFDMGHALMFRDPMLRAQRSIHRALDEAMFIALRQRSREDDERARGLDAVIGARQVITLFHPILDLRTRAVVGDEAVTRSPHEP